MIAKLLLRRPLNIVVTAKVKRQQHTMPSKLPELYESYPFINPERFKGKLQGKVAIVTGASVGIGRHIAPALASAGALVACIARRSSELNTLVDSITANGGRALAISADISARGAPQKIVSQVETQLGPVDILVNNAGITRIGPVALEDEDMQFWWRVYEVNVRAPVSMIRAVLPSMLERKTGGVLLTVSSAVATMNLPAMSAYNSSKAAISKFHEGITAELAGTGILSFAMNPGRVPSELGKADGAINPDATGHPVVRKFMEMAQGGGRRQEPNLAADTVVALVAEQRCRILHGRHVDAVNDLEAVVQEAEKEGMGKVGAEDLYLVRIAAL